ncbi:MAG: peptide chain release factor N(5)-glutamine methyltransferase [Ectothiorhodospiraceae bacterium]|nr:peptide chain release factor N(5)-glutamine methyltransferase [Ectothiorhodospiraceae bacterium]
MVGLGSVLLAGAGDSPRLEAELLCAHGLGADRSLCFSHPERLLSAEEEKRCRTLLEKRRLGEPVAYLLGRRGFWTLDLEVDARVLIPRPETELLVERCLAHVPADADGALADLGTGSGAIALALASERPNCPVTAVELSRDALSVARANARRLGLEVEWLRGSWLAPLAGRQFMLIASNPPYVADNDPHLREGDVRHEPLPALTAGPDGLDALHRIVADAPAHLQPGGWLVLEHGYNQRAAVQLLLQHAGFTNIACHRDLAGQPRVSEGQRPLAEDAA